MPDDNRVAAATLKGAVETVASILADYGVRFVLVVAVDTADDDLSVAVAKDMSSPEDVHAYLARTAVSAVNGEEGFIAWEAPRREEAN